MFYCFILYKFSTVRIVYGRATLNEEFFSNASIGVFAGHNELLFKVFAGPCLSVPIRSKKVNDNLLHISGLLSMEYYFKRKNL